MRKKEKKREKLTVIFHAFISKSRGITKLTEQKVKFLNENDI